MMSPARRSPTTSSLRERATAAHEFDPAEISHGKHSDATPPIGIAILPLLVVVGVNLLMSLLILPRLDFSFLAQERWGSTSLAGVAGVWSVAVALAAASATLIIFNWRVFPLCHAELECAGARCCPFSPSPVWSGLAPSLPRFLLSQLCVTGCCQSQAGRLFACHCHECPCCPDRFGLGQIGSRSRCAWRYLPAACRRHRKSIRRSCTASPSSVPHARQLAAQWRCR